MYEEKAKYYEENAKYPGINTTSEVDRVVKGHAQMEGLAKACEELSRYTDKLESRLGHVMQPQPKSDSATGTPREQLPPFLQEIQNATDKINFANYCLKSILSRLEI